MNYSLLYLLPLTLLISAPLRSCDWEAKKAKAAEKELDLSCVACNKYVLTHHTTTKGYIFWETIVRPSEYTLHDAPSLLPVSCLPILYCNGCKNLCAEPVIYRKGDMLKAAYRIVSTKQK